MARDVILISQKIFIQDSCVMLQVQKEHLRISAVNNLKMFKLLEKLKNKKKCENIPIIPNNYYAINLSSLT